MLRFIFFVIAFFFVALQQTSAQDDVANRRMIGYKIPGLNIPYPHDRVIPQWTPTTTAAPVVNRDTRDTEGEVANRRMIGYKIPGLNIPYPHERVITPWTPRTTAAPVVNRDTRDTDGEVANRRMIGYKIPGLNIPYPHDRVIPQWTPTSTAAPVVNRDARDVTMIPSPMDFSLFRSVRQSSEDKQTQNDIPQDNGILKIPSFYMPNRAFAGRYRPSRSIIEEQADGILDYPIEFIFARGPRDANQENPEANLIIPPWYMPNRAFAGRYANRQSKPQE